MDLREKVYLAVSLWDYPFGGGEEYIHQTMEWTRRRGMRNYWISFSDSTNANYQEFQIISKENYVSVRLPEGLTVEKLVSWISLLKPDIVHHQGHHHEIFHEACQLTRTEYMTGVHFWNNFIKLNPSTFNIDILDHAHLHQADPVFRKILASRYSHTYVVSDFVRDVISKVCGVDLPVVYSGSSESRCLVDKKVLKAHPPVYITAINIHRNKGGELILHMMQQLRHIPFIVIQTEHHSGELDREIKEEVRLRNIGAEVTSQYHQRMDNMRYIYQETKILMAPSLVDETFCRTAHEAMMNGIPVVTTGKGNLSRLVTEESCLIPADNPALWKETLERLWGDQEEYHRVSAIMSERYVGFSERVCQSRFWEEVQKVMEKSKEKNVMIYCPWCDQGLGIQSRNYYRILEKNGYRVFIFSYKPYNGDSTISLQKKPEEWAVPHVYYSQKDREHVRDTELLDFVIQNNIGKCLIPETCWNRVFEIAQLMRSHHVKCYAIPNVEIIRKDELNKHRHFHKILCNNHICQELLRKYGISNTIYVGYGVYDKTFKIQMKHLRGANNVRFLFIGGMNAFSRKHILEICEAFVQVCETMDNIELTCTIQKTNQLETKDIEGLERYLNHPKIRIVQDHLTYQAIMDLYREHDVSIQVSKHEGLGLGFYEALMTGTPVITLNVPPHNEIIREGVNGWIVECYTKPMTDNNNGLIESAYFRPSLLAERIQEIASRPEELAEICRKLFFDYLDTYEFSIFEKRFMEAIST